MSFVKRAAAWLDDRLGFSSSILPIIEHPVPRSTNWWYVFGSATLVAFIVQVVTGVALAFVYVPSPATAYETLEWITYDATLGNVLRGIHYWGASAMVVLIVAHTFRTFLMGSYKFPRELNWLSGVILLLLTIAMAFTGQLLRWNQDAYWAVVVGAAQAAKTPFIGEYLARIIMAGDTVGGHTLTRFYATHVFLIPALMFLLIGAHLYLVVKHGISERPVPGEKVERETYRERYDHILEHHGMPFWPEGVFRDIVFAVFVGSIVVVLSVVFGAPAIGEPVDPTDLEAYPRPDWYLLWYFSLLAIVPPDVEDVFIIGFPLLIGIVLIALPLLAPLGERSAWRRPWAVGTVGLVAVAIPYLIYLGYQAPWSPEIPPPELPAEVTAGLDEQVQLGAQIFVREACVSCHLVGDVGGLRGPELTDAGQRLNEEQLTWRILYGGEGMPAYGQSLEPNEVEALVAFIQRGLEDSPSASQ